MAREPEDTRPAVDDSSDRGSEAPITRRTFMKFAGAAGLAAGLGPVLAACGGGGGAATSASTSAAASTGAAQTGAAATGPTGRAVKIALISSLTGPLAPFGQTDAYTVAQMKKIFANGIDIGGMTHPIDFELKDSQSDPTRAAQLTQSVIDGGVDIIIPGFTPDITNAVGDTAEANGVPALSWAAPWQPWFFRNANVTPTTTYKWQYHFFWGLEDIIAVFLDMWSKVPTNKVVGALWPNDPDGNAWSDPKLGFPTPLKSAGYTVVDPGRYTNGTDDFTPQISKFKSAGVQVVTGVPIPPDFPTFWTQASQQGFKPKVVSVGKALLFPSSVDSLPDDLGNGLSSEMWWGETFPFKSSLTGQTAQQLADAWTSATNQQWTQPLGYAHAGFEVATDALKRTTDIESHASVLDAIKTTSLDTIAGHVSWSAQQVAKVGTQPIKNVAKMKLAGGQWTLSKGGKFKYDFPIVSNSVFPEVQTAASMQPLPG